MHMSRKKLSEPVCYRGWRKHRFLKIGARASGIVVMREYVRASGRSTRKNCGHYYQSDKTKFPPTTPTARLDHKRPFRFLLWNPLSWTPE
jgi:hypothetical protein